MIKLQMVKPRTSDSEPKRDMYDKFGHTIVLANFNVTDMLIKVGMNLEALKVLHTTEQDVELTTLDGFTFKAGLEWIIDNYELLQKKQFHSYEMLVDLGYLWKVNNTELLTLALDEEVVKLTLEHLFKMNGIEDAYEYFEGIAYGQDYEMTNFTLGEICDLFLKALYYQQGYLKCKHVYENTIVTPFEDVPEEVVKEKCDEFYNSIEKTWKLPAGNHFTIVPNFDVSILAFLQILVQNKDYVSYHTCIKNYLLNIDQTTIPKKLGLQVVYDIFNSLYTSMFELYTPMKYLTCLEVLYLYIISSETDIGCGIDTVIKNYLRSSYVEQDGNNNHINVLTPYGKDIVKLALEEKMSELLPNVHVIAKEIIVNDLWLRNQTGKPIKAEHYIPEDPLSMYKTVNEIVTYLSLLAYGQKPDEVKGAVVEFLKNTDKVIPKKLTKNELNNIIDSIFDSEYFKFSELKHLTCLEVMYLYLDITKTEIDFDIAKFLHGKILELCGDQDNHKPFGISIVRVALDKDTGVKENLRNAYDIVTLVINGNSWIEKLAKGK